MSTGRPEGSKQFAVEVTFLSSGESNILSFPYSIKWIDFELVLKCCFDVEDIEIKYIDNEEDQIGINSEEEFQEALRVSKMCEDVIRLIAFGQEKTECMNYQLNETEINGIDIPKDVTKISSKSMGLNAATEVGKDQAKVMNPKSRCLPSDTQITKPKSSNFSMKNGSVSSNSPLSTAQLPEKHSTTNKHKASLAELPEEPCIAKKPKASTAPLSKRRKPKASHDYYARLASSVGSFWPNPFGEEKVQIHEDVKPGKLLCKHEATPKCIDNTEKTDLYSKENTKGMDDSDDSILAAKAVAHLQISPKETTQVISSDLLTAEDILSFEMLKISDRKECGLRPASTVTPNNTPIGMTPCISPVPHMDDLLCIEQELKTDRADEHSTNGGSRENQKNEQSDPVDCDSASSCSDDLLEDFVVPLPDCFNIDIPLKSSTIEHHLPDIEVFTMLNLSDLNDIQDYEEIYDTDINAYMEKTPDQGTEKHEDNGVKVSESRRDVQVSNKLHLSDVNDMQNNEEIYDDPDTNVYNMEKTPDQGTEKHENNEGRVDEVRRDIQVPDMLHIPSGLNNIQDDEEICGDADINMAKTPDQGADNNEHNEGKVDEARRDVYDDGLLELINVATGAASIAGIIAKQVLDGAASSVQALFGTQNQIEKQNQEFPRDYAHYNSAMDQLIEMGFANRELNSCILAKFNDNIHLAVQNLLSEENNNWSETRH